MGDPQRGFCRVSIAERGKWGNCAQVAEFCEERKKIPAVFQRKVVQAYKMQVLPLKFQNRYAIICNALVFANNTFSVHGRY